MPGTRFSRLDACAEAVGAPVIDRAFEDVRPLRSLAGALARIIDDEERAVLALKKSLHWMVEARLRTLALRADPPEDMQTLIRTLLHRVT